MTAVENTQKAITEGGTLVAENASVSENMPKDISEVLGGASLDLRGGADQRIDSYFNGSITVFPSGKDSIGSPVRHSDAKSWQEFQQTQLQGVVRTADQLVAQNATKIQPQQSAAEILGKNAVSEERGNVGFFARLFGRNK